MLNKTPAYLSVCSGIEAATVAWHGLGWRAAGFSEIEAFPRAVLQHHYPDVPLHGDFTTLIASPPDVDVLVGGTPCQAFSVAGKRASLEDARGNLSLAYIELANAIDDLRFDRGQAPCVVVWENVPGVLSVQDNAFGCFLGGLVGCDAALVPTGGRWTNAGMVAGPKRRAAWRVLDAQYFGLAQRRARVFVVASARDGFDPAAVLFEPEGMRRHFAPRRETGERTAPTLAARTKGGGGLGTDAELDGALIAANEKDIAKTLLGHAGRTDGVTETFVVHALRSEGFDASEDGTGRGVPLVPAWPAEVAPTLNAAFGDKQGLEDQHALNGARLLVAHSVAIPLLEVGKRTGTSTDDPRAGLGVGNDGDPMFTLQRGAQHAVAFDTTQITSPSNYSNPQPGDPCHTLAKGAHAPAIDFAMRGREDGAVPEVHEQGNTASALRAASGGSTRDMVAFQTRGGDLSVGDISGTMGTNSDRASGGAPMVAQTMQVRRLTPRECERLQGFPDDYTLVPHRGKPAADGPRFKALGNSMAVPVMAWIGNRINNELRNGVTSDTTPVDGEVDASTELVSHPPSAENN